MRYKVFLDRKAQKNLDNMESDISDSITEKIVKLKTGFVPELDIKKLRGYSNHYRLRVGGYRVLFQLQKGHVIIVYAVLPRKKAYK
ncbi:type II toxin-antitoxin system RelE family toxin [Methanobacterium petrolearium]|uniref:type II toxin-antitoxin system RelE family toxin n=1 Tax=Methanobacterium petrolearium TaxID=710190 RepID=UPI001AEB8EBB|nr:type II toxin-antitoxin system RelE/ParE family toxin [Methanobacterium petrolearium]MBP1947023.1 mRNA interferase RelE/StbE [Methanobacterium petrolearium]BDZ71451.1 plasmid stabilization protein [Methanobacterium petrolearium]